jgi:hypothetical protein
VRGLPSQDFQRGDSASRGKGPDGDLAICDQCGRIIYFES